MVTPCATPKRETHDVERPRIFNPPAFFACHYRQLIFQWNMEACPQFHIIDWLKTVSSSRQLLSAHGDLDDGHLIASVSPAQLPESPCLPSGHTLPIWHGHAVEAMDGSEETASTISGATGLSTSLVHRPILTPTPPSTRRGAKGTRSPSPIRKSMSLLERATPSDFVSQEGLSPSLPRWPHSAGFWSMIWAYGSFPLRSR